MGKHPANLALRFLLEVLALLILGFWGWHRGDDGFKILIALAVPLIAALFWGTFAVPNDPTRSGSAPVPIPGMLRLLLEGGFFTFATWALYDLRFTPASAIFGTTVVFHYLVSYDRIRWLAGQ
jgi:hypothetical protein